MLVLSRKQHDKVLFPSLGITVEVLRLNGKAVRLGISAPKKIAVMRHEVALTDARPEPAALRAALQRDDMALLDRLRDAADSLIMLQQQLEEEGSEDAEPAIYKIFCDLQLLGDEVTKRPTGSAAANTNNRDGGGRNILLVEDNFNEAQLLAGFLRFRNYEVSLANNGSGAIQHLCKNESPACVLLDMNMPKFDGRWTIQEIRRNPRHADLKVFAVSGIHPAEYGVDLGPTGINRWFRKPLDPEALIRDIQSDMAMEVETVIA